MCDCVGYVQMRPTGLYVGDHVRSDHRQRVSLRLCGFP